MEVELFYIRHPANILIAGPSGSGKTTFMKHLLERRDQLIHPNVKKIHWFYSEWQQMYEHMRELYGVEFHKGLPSEEMFEKECPNSIVIIDDQMSDLGKEVENIFTKKSHHSHVTVIVIIQNLFNKNLRTMSINSHCIVLLKNPRDQSIVTNLAKQMYPTNARFLQKAYSDATQKPYSHLVIDLHQETPEYARIRANIFSTDEQYVYQPE